MKTGTWLSLLAVLGGVWVMLAPVIAGFAPKHGNPWHGVILGTDIIGALVVAVALVGLIGSWGLHLRSLAEKAATQEPLED